MREQRWKSQVGNGMKLANYLASGFLQCVLYHPRMDRKVSLAWLCSSASKWVRKEWPHSQLSCVIVFTLDSFLIYSVMNSCMYAIHCGHIYSFIFFSFSLLFQYPSISSQQGRTPAMSFGFVWYLLCDHSLVKPVVWTWNYRGQWLSLLHLLGHWLLWARWTTRSLLRAWLCFWIQTHGHPMQSTTATVRCERRGHIRCRRQNSAAFFHFVCCLLVWPFRNLPSIVFSELCRGLYGPRLIIQQALVISTFGQPWVSLIATEHFK